MIRQSTRATPRATRAWRRGGTKTVKKMTGSISFDAVVAAVARHFAISKEQVHGGGRYRRQRRIAHYLAWRLTRRSFPEIGRQIGGIDHTGVVHGVRIIQGAMADDAVFAAEIELLCDQLTASGS